MADIVQANVVVTQTSDDEDYSGQRYNRMFPQIAFGNGALTYPANGIPLPDISQFRLKRNIKRLYIQQPPDGYEYRYDPTVRVGAPYGTIRIFQGGAVVASTVAAASAGTPAGSNAAESSHAHSVPSGTDASGGTTGAGASHNHAFTGSALATHTHTLNGGGAAAGALAELGNVAVAATVLPLEILGA